MEVAKLFAEQIPKRKEEALIRLHGPRGIKTIKV